MNSGVQYSILIYSFSFLNVEYFQKGKKKHIFHTFSNVYLLLFPS
jgi:hypothetical protein